MAAMGVPVPGTEDPDITPLDRSVLAVMFDGGTSGRWYGRGGQTWTAASDPVGVAHVLAVAEFTGRPVDEILDRLAALGLAAPATAAAYTGSVDQTDMVLVSRTLNGRGPWCGDGPVPLGHVIAAAGHLRWTPARVVDRLAELGLDPPTLTDSARTAYIDGVDIALVSASRERYAPPITDEQISRAHLLANSHHFGRPAGRIAERLAELGFTVPRVHVTDFAM